MHLNTETQNSGKTDTLPEARPLKQGILRQTPNLYLLHHATLTPSEKALDWITGCVVEHPCNTAKSIVHAETTQRSQVPAGSRAA